MTMTRRPTRRHSDCKTGENKQTPHHNEQQPRLKFPRYVYVSASAGIKRRLKVDVQGHMIVCDQDETKEKYFFPLQGNVRNNSNKKKTKMKRDLAALRHRRTPVRENDHSIALQGMQRASPDHFHARRLVLKDFHRYCTKSLQK